MPTSIFIVLYSFFRLDEEKATLREFETCVSTTALSEYMTRAMFIIESIIEALRNFDLVEYRR